MKTGRRDFLRATSGLLTGLPLLAQCAQIKSDRALGNKPLLYAKKYSIDAAMKRAEAGEKGNIPPVIREEILDNPNAVFIIRTRVQSQKKDDGSFPNEKEQMERAGFDAGFVLLRTLEGHRGV